MPASTGSSHWWCVRRWAIARQGPHDANLFDLQAKYAEVVSLAEAEAYLGGLLARPAARRD